MQQAKSSQTLQQHKPWHWYCHPFPSIRATQLRFGTSSFPERDWQRDDPLSTWRPGFSLKTCSSGDVDESGWVMICWHSTTCPSKVGIQVSVNAKLLGTRVHLPIWDGYGQQKLHPYKLVSQFHRAFKLQIAWEGNGLLRCKKTLESGLILLEPSSWIMKIRQGHFSPCGKEAPLAALTKIPTVNSGRSRSLPSWQFDH